MAGGWLKLYRDTLDHEVFQEDWIWRLWTWCLMRANHQETFVRGQKLSPGQFITGRITGSAELKVSPSKWYRGIQRLCDLNCITISANSNWTTVSVCNWGTYQDSAQQERTASDTTSGQPVIQRADTEEEGKNVRREELDSSDRNQKNLATRRKTPKVDGHQTEIPSALDTAEFRKLWNDWCDEKRDRRQQMTPRGWQTQITALSSFGHEVASKAILVSLANGWQGLFPEKVSQNGTSSCADLFAGLRESSRRAAEREGIRDEQG